MIPTSVAELRVVSSQAELETAILPKVRQLYPTTSELLCPVRTWYAQVERHIREPVAQNLDRCLQRRLRRTHELQQAVVEQCWTLSTLALRSL